MPLNSRILGSAINIDVLISSKWLAREDIKVQIVENFFLGRGRFFSFFTRICRTRISRTIRTIRTCKYKVTRVIDKFHYAENESDIRK